MAEALQFDPTSEDSTNSPLTIMSATYRVLAHSYPAPPQTVQYAGTVDTEGSVVASRKHENRQITMSLECVGASAAAAHTALAALQAKVSKIAREGGTLKRTLLSSEVIVFDLLTADTFNPTFDIKYEVGNVIGVDVEFAAKPYGRSASVTTFSAVSETTAPMLSFTVSDVPGDVPALGRLVIADVQGVDQSLVLWGLERGYVATSNNILLVQAETRTGLGGSTIVAGPSGASGAGSNVMRSAGLSTAWLAVLSTQTNGGGAHLDHVGDYRVWGRVQVPTTNTGQVSVALEWGEGDFRTWTRNAPVTFPANTYDGSWRLVDLGQVHPTKVVAGTQRWEGRVVAKSTVSGDAIDIDCLMLQPVRDGSGRVQSIDQNPAPTAFSAQDYFDQTSGNLGGKTLPVGGTWTTAGATTDFTLDTTNHRAQRNVATDTLLSGRYAVASTPTLTSMFAYVTMMVPTGATGHTRMGLTARYVDISNVLRLWLSPDEGTLVLDKKIAGSVTGLWSAPTPLTVLLYPVLVATMVSLGLKVTNTGEWAVYIVKYPSGFAEPIATGYDPDLAGGGTLASGKVGLYDESSTDTVVRGYDGVLAWALPADAAMFASQSIEVRHDRVIREDAGGTLWQTPSSYEGDYLLVPPEGAENRDSRMFVKASRGLPTTGVDAGIDDIAAQLFVTARYLVVP